MSIYEIITIIASIIGLFISILAIWYSRKQHLSSIKPELWTNGVLINQYNLFFDIGSRKNTAKIIKITPKTNNITIISKCPIEIPEGEDEVCQIKVEYKGDINKIDNDPIVFDIKYTDKENNKYQCTYTYSKQICSIK